MNSNNGSKYELFKRSNCIRISKNRVLIDLEVTPGSNQSGIKGYNRWRDRIQINIHSPARKGAANKELINLISDLLNISFNDIKIIKGSHSELKTIELVDLDYETVINTFFEALNE